MRIAIFLRNWLSRDHRATIRRLPDAVGRLLVRVYEIHERVLASGGGGIEGLRDAAMLHSAVARPFATFGGVELYPGDFENPLEPYLRALHRIRASGAGTPELSYYSALATLFSTVGEGLDPEVRCIMPLADQGAGFPDGGYPVIKKWLSYREERVLGRHPRPEEARTVTNIARRITAILMMGPALDENYAAVKRAGFEWPPRLAEPSELGFAGILILALAGAYLLRERIAAQVGVRPPTGDPGRAELTLPAGFTFDEIDLQTRDAPP